VESSAQSPRIVDEDEVDEHTLEVTPSHKRRLSSSSTSQTSNTKSSKRKPKAQSARSEMADAIHKLSASIVIARTTGPAPDTTGIDFVAKALEILQSEEMSLELTTEEQALGMAVFLDEKKAKIFCLAKATRLRILFIRREIEKLE
jgi:hypothetical protein